MIMLVLVIFQNKILTIYFVGILFNERRINHAQNFYSDGKFGLGLTLK